MYYTNKNYTIFSKFLFRIIYKMLNKNILSEQQMLNTYSKYFCTYSKASVVRYFWYHAFMKKRVKQAMLFSF